MRVSVRQHAYAPPFACWPGITGRRRVAGLATFLQMRAGAYRRRVGIHVNGAQAIRYVRFRTDGSCRADWSWALATNPGHAACGTAAANAWLKHIN